MIGIIGLAAAVPTIIGVNEATKGTQDHEKKRRDASRKQRSHLISTCELTAAPGRDREQIYGAKVVLRNGLVGRSFHIGDMADSTNSIQMYIDKKVKEGSHPFTGVYHNHPLLAPNNMCGLVTTISEDPPLLRWVFVDVKTFEVRYGSRTDSEGHIIGPWFVQQTSPKGAH
jgi:hypothetical protein